MFFSNSIALLHWKIFGTNYSSCSQLIFSFAFSTLTCIFLFLSLKINGGYLCLCSKNTWREWVTRCRKLRKKILRERKKFHPITYSWDGIYFYELLFQTIFSTLNIVGILFSVICCVTIIAFSILCFEFCSKAKLGIKNWADIERITATWYNKRSNHWKVNNYIEMRWLKNYEVF